MENLSISEARSKFSTITDTLEKDAEKTLTVTRRGKPVLAIMAYDLYDSLTETLEILADEELMASLRQGIKEIQEGKTFKWKDVKKELEK